jgi:hypothetical protein
VTTPAAPARPAPSHVSGGGHAKPADPAASPTPRPRADSIPAVLGLGNQVAVRGVGVPAWIPLLALVALLAAPIAASRVANRHR